MRCEGGAAPRLGPLLPAPWCRAVLGASICGLLALAQCLTAQADAQPAQTCGAVGLEDDLEGSRPLGEATCGLQAAAPTRPSLYDSGLTVEDIEGNVVSLADLRGKVGGGGLNCQPA